MNRNTIIGILLIVAILIGTNLLFSPKKNPDAPVTKEAAQRAAEGEEPLVQDEEATAPLTLSTTDSLLPQPTAVKDSLIMLENEHMRVGISTRGGRIAYVQLKQYLTYHEEKEKREPLVLVRPQHSSFSYTIPTNSGTLHTGEMAFAPSGYSAGNRTAPATLTMTATLPSGGSIKHNYSLEPESFLLNYDLLLNGLGNDIPRRNQYFDLDWSNDIAQHEKDSAIMYSNTTVHYKQTGETPDYLSEGDEEQERISLNTEWVSFKEQFFARSLITTERPFEAIDIATVNSKDAGYVKTLKATLTIPYQQGLESQAFPMQFYFGPLHYSTLRALEYDLERQIPLGWSFFITAWVNRFVIIPVFNILNNFIGNYGIIILVLTIFIKIIVLFFTYRSYLSSAKMRLLKPEIDKLKEKNKDDMMAQQQDQMRLYRASGVNPAGGCLPLLFQFPILISMFRFFPSSIELRQESFLWADDLSTYDSIYNLPFHIPGYGDHISLFTLLMTISTIIYTRISSNQMAQQQKELQWVQYLMPVIFLGMFNNYSAGLSLYYLYFNLLTFGQQALFKRLINEDALRAKLEANRLKPKAEKKGGLTARLAEMQKMRDEQMRGRKQGPPPTGRKGGKRPQK